MNQDIKASTLLLVTLIFGGLLFAKFWASSTHTSITVYSYLHHHPEGDSYIKLSDKLFGFDAEGKYQKTIELSRFNLQEYNASDFSFFSNGDLLLRLKVQENNFIENLQRYFRFTNPTDKHSKNKGEGLFRCSLLTYKCTAFSSQALNINEAFALTIDWVTDRVFIADTSRHQVYMYSSQGLELDSAEGFIFPNQIEVHNNELFVADTNHHRLVSFDISHNEIGAKQENFDTRTIESRKSGEIWPASFLLLGKQRWVINSKNGMSHGGIYVFDNSGELIKSLKLPTGADPFAMIQMGKQILVTDFTQDRIYRLNLEGDYLDEFNPPVLQTIQKQLTQQRAHYQWLDNLFSILFAACLCAGFILALYQQNQMKKAALADPCLTQRVTLYNADEPVLHWLKASTRARILSALLFAFCIICYLILALIYWLKGSSITEFLALTWQAQLIIVITFSVLFLQLRRKFAITENTVIVYPLIGAKTICPKAEIISNDVHILFGKSIFQIQQLYQMFSASDIENYLYPAIKQGKQVTRIEMQAILAGNKKVRILQFVMISILMGLFIYYGVFSSVIN